MSTVYIRPTVIEDAKVSYKWRNIPRLWKYTAFKTDKEITYEVEKAWLEKKLEQNNEFRFSICLVENDQYIGYMFINNITEDEGEIHTVIGEMAYWGGGRAKDAAKLVLDSMFKNTSVKQIITKVNVKNLGAIKLTLDMGFEKTHEEFHQETGFDLVVFRMTKESFYEQFPDFK
ncbi:MULTISPECIES: GNAT family N-acetyltransferase [unclassified Paraflavitalea]|uniref:GNAT family N-acetyltransferase n=1 Tax=unclassified Paraflavitalea TaxID=2798305 RepID=UPI003D34634C